MINTEAFPTRMIIANRFLHKAARTLYDCDLHLQEAVFKWTSDCNEVLSKGLVEPILFRRREPFIQQQHCESASFSSAWVMESNWAEIMLELAVRRWAHILQNRKWAAETEVHYCHLLERC